MLRNRPGYGLNEKGPHRLLYLNVCSVVGGTVWDRLGNVALHAFNPSIREAEAGGSL